MAVDKNFFENIFDAERRKLQKQLGLNNLSQPDFSKMIKGLKIKPLKNTPPNFQTKKKMVKRHGIFKI